MIRNKENNVIIGGNIKAVRGKKKTQVETATHVGVKRVQYQRYERGITRIDATMLWELAQLFGCKINRLYKGCRKGTTYNKNTKGCK